MSDKDLIMDGIRLAMMEIMFDCNMEKDRKKNTKETTEIMYGFSKYSEALDDLVDDYDFGVFLDDIFGELKKYLVGNKDYKSTVKKIKKYKKSFVKFSEERIY